MDIFSNWWCIYAILAIVGFVIIGFKRYRLTGCRIKKVLHERVLFGIAVFAAVIFMLMLLMESWDGIVAYFDHMLYADSQVWPTIAAIIVILVVSFLFGFVLYIVGFMVGLLRYTSLQEKLKQQQANETTMTKEDETPRD